MVMIATAIETRSNCVGLSAARFKSKVEERNDCEEA